MRMMGILPQNQLKKSTIRDSLVGNRMVGRVSPLRAATLQPGAQRTDAPYPLSMKPCDSRDTRSRLQCFHNSGGRVDHFLNVRWAVGGRDEPRLELRGGQINSFGQHGMEVFCESGAVTPHRFSQVMHGLTGEVGAEHGTAAVELQRESR